MIRVLLVDDLPLVRRALRMWLELEPDINVVGEAADGLSALALVVSCKPDVVVMDAVMPGMDGLTATTALQRLGPAPQVVIHSLYDDRISRNRALGAGACAFISKGDGVDHLLAAIRGAAIYLKPRYG